MVGTLTASVSLSGSLAASAGMAGALSSSGSLSGALTASAAMGGSMTVGDVTVQEYPDYSGSYTVTPMTTAQEIGTDDTVMKANLVVGAIPYYETSNDYGTTVSIGE